MTPLYSYIPLIYPDEVEKMIGIAEMFSALGFLFGPMLGSVFFSIGGYTLPFIVIGSLALLIIPIIGYQFHKQNNLKKIADESNHKLIVNDSILVKHNYNII